MFTLFELVEEETEKIKGEGTKGSDRESEVVRIATTIVLLPSLILPTNLRYKKEFQVELPDLNRPGCHL